MSLGSLGLSAAWKSRPAQEVARAAFGEATDELMAAGGVSAEAIGQLPRAWRDVYILVWLKDEVDNGGFHQFFTNGRGMFDRHLGDGLLEVAGPKHAIVLREAFAKYAGMDYSEQWDNVGVSWDKFAEGYEQKWFESDDDAFHAVESDLLEVVGRHIVQNFDQFESLDPASSEDASAVEEARDGALTPPEHSLGRRLQWHPLVVAIPCAYLWYSAHRRGFPVVRSIGAGFVTFWFVLSVVDFVTGHKLLDWMYDDEDE